MNDESSTFPLPQRQPDDATAPTNQMHTTDASLVGAPPPPPRKTGHGPRLSRRGLIVGATAVGVTAAALTGGILFAREKGLASPAAGGSSVTPAGAQPIAHLLRRAGFGARASEIQDYAALGFTGAVDRLLNYETVPDDLENRLSQINFDFTNVADMQRWWVLRMVFSKHPFEEKMTLFWHGLLTSSYTKVGGKTGYPYLVTQNKLLRTHALDTYDNILTALTPDAAMMWWLDLRLSQKQAPNENYARELMELFTLGVNGGYTQTDVHEAARALTGWTLPRGADTGVYRADQHDNTSKTLLGHTGNLGTADVIAIVAGHPATGPYLCKRIFEFFVHENPSDVEIKPMVDAYYNSKHSIKAVMRAMFLSPVFVSANAYRAKLKSPAEYVIGAIRQLEFETDGQGVANVISQMGQTLFNPPNVAGWPGDVSGQQWINTATWLTRVNLVNNLMALASTVAKGSTTSHLQDIITQNKLGSADALLAHFSGVLVDGQMLANQQATITTYLNATAANTRGTGQTLQLAGGGTIPTANVRNALYLLMASPEYQLN